jgi:hypothetical protein
MKIISIVFCLVLFSCTKNNSTSHLTKQIKDSPLMTKVDSDFQVIDVDCAIKVDMNFLISKLTSILYVPLKSTELIGAINKAIIYDEKIYILDAYITERLFIFDKRGNLLKMIDNKGEGPNEYAGLSGMCIDPDRKEICINDRMSISKLYYNLDGNFLRKEKSISSFYINVFNHYVINQLAVNQSFSKEINYHLVCTIKDSIYSKGFPYVPIQKNYIVSSDATFNSMGDLLFIPVLSDTVYQIESFEKYSVRYVVKHRHSVWDKHEEEFSYKEVGDLIKNNGYTALGMFYETQRYIYFSIKRGLHNFVSDSYFLFDKKKLQVYELEETNMKIFKEIVPPNLITLDKETFVASFDAFRLKELLAKDNNGYVIKNNLLYSIIEKSDEDSNPVLVMYQLK